MSLRRAFLCKRVSAVQPAPKPGKAGVSLRRKSVREVRVLPRNEEEDVVEEERGEGSGKEGGWSGLLPELLGVIIQNVESTVESWPQRRDVVACASVCKRWREVTKGVVKSPQESGNLTFPSSLKEPGPLDAPIQCYIKRNKKNSIFYLYLGLSKSLSEKGKFLLAARKIRRGAHTEYIISFDADDFSQGSNTYVGKLSSDLLGKKFTIYDCQSPYEGAKPSSSYRRRWAAQVCPQAMQGYFEIGHIFYKLNIVRSRGPRRMLCHLRSPTPLSETIECPKEPHPVSSSVILKNKAPRWHEHLQCWCLNFHGRVTVASVKNFQLVATADPSQPELRKDEETVLLQFGKVEDDIFTMDYRHPLSAFQAFAICLTSFGRKLACE